jgi:hypothetical protein
MHTFRLSGIDHEPFRELFELPDHELRRHQAVRCIATAHPGFPCRASLEDAEVGEELLLVPYLHQPADSPYRASGPIFVRREAQRRTLEAGYIPPYVSRRLISLRAYDTAHMMIDAIVCEGSAVAGCLDRWFDRAAVAYIHLHNANRGCFSCVAHRAE